MKGTAVYIALIVAFMLNVIPSSANKSVVTHSSKNVNAEHDSIPDIQENQHRYDQVFGETNTVNSDQVPMLEGQSVGTIDPKRLDQFERVHVKSIQLDPLFGLCLEILGLACGGIMIFKAFQRWERRKQGYLKLLLSGILLVLVGFAVPGFLNWLEEPDRGTSMFK